MKEISSFFKQNNLIPTVIITILSTFLTDFFISFLENIISPLIDFNNDGVEDHKNLSSYTIKINGKIIKIGLFLFSLIKLIIIMLIIVVLIYLLK
jgi:large-conductance mechanosensitive channel